MDFRDIMMTPTMIQRRNLSERPWMAQSPIVAYSLAKRMFWDCCYHIVEILWLLLSTLKLASLDSSGHTIVEGHIIVSWAAG